MPDVIERMWIVHLLLTGAAAATPDERAWAIDEAERLLRGQPPGGSRDDGLAEIEAARAGDADARQHLANSLEHVRWLLEREREKRNQRKLAGLVAKAKQRKLARLVTKAKQLGVDVTIDPNGTATFRTGSSTTTAADENLQTEVDDWIAKHAH